MCINYIYCSGKIPMPPYIVVHCLRKNDFEAEISTLFLKITLWKTRSREALSSKRKDPGVLGLDRGFRRRSPWPAMRRGRGIFNNDGASIGVEAEMDYSKSSWSISTFFSIPSVCATALAVAHIPYGKIVFIEKQNHVFWREWKRKGLCVDFSSSVLVVSSITPVTFLKKALKESGSSGIFVSYGALSWHFNKEKGLAFCTLHLFFWFEIDSKTFHWIYGVTSGATNSHLTPLSRE